MSRPVPDWEEPGLAESLAAYTALMDALVTESRYHQGEREDPDQVAYLGGIVERAAARARERGAP